MRFGIVFDYFSWLFSECSLFLLICNENKSKKQQKIKQVFRASNLARTMRIELGFRVMLSRTSSSSYLSSYGHFCMRFGPFSSPAPNARFLWTTIFVNRPSNLLFFNRLLPLWPTTHFQASGLARTDPARNFTPTCPIESSGDPLGVEIWWFDWK